jgi:hypothetical protein
VRYGDEYRAAGLPRSPSSAAEREQDREEQHLQDFAFGERANHRVGMMWNRKSTVLCWPALVV